MKAAIIIGSARKEGNTEAQAQSIAESLSEEGFEVDIIRPSELQIQHCIGCNKCVEDGSCHLGDDMQVIYDAFDDSDLFILATPVYFSGPSSIMKQVIDRFQCRWQSIDEPVMQKTVALISNGGSRNPRFENVISIARAFAFATRCRWGGECLVDSTDENDISKSAKAGYKFGKQLIEEIREDI